MQTIFSSGCLLASVQQAFFATLTEPDSELDGNAGACQVLRYDAGEWSVAIDQLPFGVTMMAAVQGAGGWIVIGMSPGGEWFEYSVDVGVATHQGALSQNYTVTGLSVVEGRVIASGMGPMVLERNGPGAWSDIGPGPGGFEGQAVVGFNAVSGLPGGGLVGVGWTGDVRTQTDTGWSRQDSPTLGNLTAVTAVGPRSICIAGERGVVLAGEPDALLALDLGEEQTFQDVAHFNDQTYLCADYQLFRLDDEGLVDLFDGVEGAPGSFLSLLVAPDGMMSVGPSSVALYDGDNWFVLI